MTDYTGGCLCGQVRFAIKAEPLTARICWCRDCQRIAGNGTVNAVFAADQVAIHGTLTTYLRQADSGHEVSRRFCPHCGSHLFASSSGRPGITVVRIGTLDQPSRIRPTANIWSASAPAWACLDSALERHDAAPPPAPPRSAEGR